jgi:retinol dehydrogenase-12
MSSNPFLADIRVLDVWSLLKQSFFIPRPTWSTDDIPDLTGKVIIVTGGNSGLGKESAKVNYFLLLLN